MNAASSLAPLASPHGAGPSPEFVPEEFVCESPRVLTPRLSVRHTLASAFRASYVELLAPAPLLAAVGAELLLVKGLVDLHPHGLEAVTTSWNLGVLCTFVFYALVLGFSTLSRFALGRSYDVEVNPAGVRKRSRFALKSHLTRWRYFVGIIELDGDLWLASWGNGCFIPGEAFATPEEAREFAAMVRALKRSNGASWRSR